MAQGGLFYLDVLNSDLGDLATSLLPCFFQRELALISALCWPADLLDCEFSGSVLKEVDL